MVRDPADLRDDLLSIARDAVRSAARRGIDPMLAGGMIVDAWLDAHPGLEVVDPAGTPPPGTVTADPAFTTEPATGVESLAFVVHGSLGACAAGIILRLPGDYPDSFEVVAMPDSSPDGTPAAIRAAFYR